MRRKKVAAVKERKIDRGLQAISILQQFLECARELRGPRGEQMWATMFPPDTATQICEVMGWEVATIGRDTRNLPPGTMNPKEKPLIVVP